VSANQCSVAFDLEETYLDEQGSVESLMLYRKGRHYKKQGCSAIIDIVSDVIELGGTITISF